MQSIPQGQIRKEGFTFSDLIFFQLRMAKELEKDIMLKPPGLRKDAIVSLYQVVRGIETSIWGEIYDNKTYLSEKRGIDLDFSKIVNNTQGFDSAGILRFSDSLDKWLKLLTLYLRSFDFYPARPRIFVSGEGLMVGAK